MDLNRQPDYDTPLWSETRWDGCFNPDNGAGLYLHAGRLRGNIDWWWAQTVIYLPGGQIAVERSWVHNPDPDGVHTPSLDLRVHKTGWSARFDAMAQICSTEQLATAPRGSGSPVTPVTFEVSGDNSRPEWDMYQHHVDGQDFAGDMHIEQAGRSTGTLTIDGQTHSLDGVSYHDHSCGVRDWTGWGGHHFAVIVMPTETIHAIGIYLPDGTPRAPVGTWITADGQHHALKRAEIPHLADLLGQPRHYEMVIQSDSSEPHTFQVEIVNAFPTTIMENNDNINGIDTDTPENPLYLIESQAIFTDQDGTIGHGHVSRCRRRNDFDGVQPLLK